MEAETEIRRIEEILDAHNIKIHLKDAASYRVEVVCNCLKKTQQENEILRKRLEEIQKLSSNLPRF